MHIKNQKNLSNIHFHQKLDGLMKAKNKKLDKIRGILDKYDDSIAVKEADHPKIKAKLMEEGVNKNNPIFKKINKAIHEHT